MPFAGFKNFQECLTHVKKKNPNYTDEQAGGVCGVIEKRWKVKHGNE